MSRQESRAAPARLIGGAAGTQYLYRPDEAPAFDPVLFDRAALERSGRVLGEAGAGRGNTVIVDWHGTELVLREYLRGGAVRHVSERHYLTRGLQRSRPAREFHLLCALQARGLPVAPAFAARHTRRGPLERGMLITRRVPGETLAARLVGSGGAGDESMLDAVGACIARFHAQGVWHADLNAHNIMVHGGGTDARVTLIDFDRGRMGAWPAGLPQPPRAAVANLQRLSRSLDRLLEAEAAGRVAQRLTTAWRARFAPSPGR